MLQSGRPQSIFTLLNQTEAREMLRSGFVSDLATYDLYQYVLNQKCWLLRAIFEAMFPNCKNSLRAFSGN